MPTTALRYDELAHRLGIKVPTARRMANKHRWRKTKDNHGRALVHVPEEYFARRAETLEAPPRASASGSAPMPGLMPAPGPDPVPAHMAALMARLEVLEHELMDAVQRLGAAEGALRVVTDDRDRWHAMAEALQRQLAERRPGWLSRLFRKAG